MLRPSFRGSRLRPWCDEEERSVKGDILAAIAGSAALVAAEVLARKLFPELFEAKSDE